MKSTTNRNKLQIRTIQNKVTLLSEIEAALKAIYGKNFQNEFNNLIADGFTLEQINRMLQNQLGGSSYSHKN